MATTTEPMVIIRNVYSVDDAGGVHYESVWTARFLKSLIDNDVLRFENNIRPDHNPEHGMGTKTRRKIDTWARELLENNAVIGNLSVRLDPDNAYFDIKKDEDGDEHLVLYRGILDTGVDSQSRIKAIVRALNSPIRTLEEETRFAVRIWIANDELAHRVAANYNTRGDKVNDTAAKWAYQETAEQRLARKLVQDSPHLGHDNVEVLSNTVSANSHKLLAFNTLAKGLELFWNGDPLSPQAERDQAAFLVDFWDALVSVRPEYGRLTKADRQQRRKNSVSGTAVCTHGLIAVAWNMCVNEVDLSSALRPLGEQISVGDRTMDYFSYDNPVWTKIGVLVPGRGDHDGQPRSLTLRTSFQSRDAMATELLRKLGLPETGPVRAK